MYCALDICMFVSETLNVKVYLRGLIISGRMMLKIILKGI